MTNSYTQYYFIIYKKYCLVCLGYTRDYIIITNLFF